MSNWWRWKYKNKRKATDYNNSYKEKLFKDGGSTSNDNSAKRSNDGSVESSLLKRQKLDTNDTMDTTTAHSVDTRSAGNGSDAPAANSGGIGVRGEVQLHVPRPYPSTKFSRTYQKTYYLRIKPYKYTVSKYADGNLEYRRITYSYHDLPVQSLGFYLSLDEINKLNLFTRATVDSVNVECISRTARLPFYTNQSITSVGNNNVGVYLLTFRDLNKDRIGNFDGAQYRETIQNIFWGEHIKDIALGKGETTEAISSLGAQYCVRNYDLRFQYASPIKMSADSFNKMQYIPDAFPIQRYIDNRINASMDEGAFMNYSYKPKNGYIFGHNSLAGFCTCTVNPNMQGLALTAKNAHTYNRVQWEKDNGKNSNVNETGGKGIGTINSESGHNIPEIYDNVYNYHVCPMRNNKDPWIININSHSGIYNIGGMYKDQPSCCFGLEPIINDDAQNSIVDCYLDIEVKTTCVVNITDGVSYANERGGYVVQPNYMRPQVGIADFEDGSKHRYLYKSAVEMDTGIGDRLHVYNNVMNYPVVTELGTKSYSDYGALLKANPKSTTSNAKKNTATASKTYSSVSTFLPSTSSYEDKFNKNIDRILALVPNITIPTPTTTEPPISASPDVTTERYPFYVTNNNGKFKLPSYTDRFITSVRYRKYHGEQYMIFNDGQEYPARLFGRNKSGTNYVPRNKNLFY